MSKYPTSKEILNKIEKPSKETLQIIEEWKNKWYYKKWSKKNNINKLIALKDLAKGLVIHKTSFKMSNKWYATIPLNINGKGYTLAFDQNNPSILSCLHEIGHINHGASELKACRYSIGIFKEAFPKEYSRLTWRGHMLVKK